MGSSVIFAGTKVKSLKSTLSLNGGADIISSATDPTSSAYDAPIGAILLNTVNGNVYRKLDAGSSTNWVLIQSGSGGVNYVTNGEFEVNSTGFSTYADGAAAPVDGGGGSPTLTFARTTSSPLRGTGSGLLTPGALGDGVAYGFTISRADYARMLKVSFDYELGTYASYTDGDVGVYIISASDSGFTTNLEVTQCAPYKVLKVSGQETFETVFQSHVSNQYYRICIHQITAATGYTMKVDNVSCGPQSVAYGAPVSDPKTETAVLEGTGSNPTLGTTTINRVTWERVGTFMFIQCTIRQTSAGSAGSGNLLFKIPGGYSIDTNFYAADSGNQWTIVGNGGIDAGSDTLPSINVCLSIYDSTRLYINQASNSFFARTPTSYISHTTFPLTFVAKVPILGWSSSVEVSNDASTRVVGFSGYITGANTAADSTFTDVQINTKEIDTHGAFNTSNYTYTVPVLGLYDVSGFFYVTGGTWSGSEQQRIIIYKNGSAVRTIYSNPQSSDTFPSSHISTTVSCVAGDTLKLVYRQTSGNTTTFSTGSAESNFSIKRVSGPAQIAANETISANYYTTTVGSVTANTPTNFNTKRHDSHGAVTTGAGVWKFTAPIAGYYRISANYQYGATGGTPSIYKNGSDTGILFGVCNSSGFGSGSTTISLVAGDYIDLRFNATATPSDSASISIERI